MICWGSNKTEFALKLPLPNRKLSDKENKIPTLTNLSKLSRTNAIKPNPTLET